MTTRYSILATGTNVKPIIVIGTTMNNGNVEATIQFLQDAGYTSITVVKLGK
jgi:hypothetical protein